MGSSQARSSCEDALSWYGIAKVGRNAPLHSMYVTLIDFLEDAISELAASGFDVAADLASSRAVVAAIAEGRDRPLALARSAA